ncbi:nose resistant to fluoxetine protein 6-like [Periplaneta americana]|uniref:nose resistant to fluoxetine protein 6-like n=1 Tax=Periplaneta americana TaxID=6978 RepID=UPI0037E861A5
MVDASSKLQSGLLQGNVFHLGNYDECLDVEVNEQWGSFVGQYCLVASIFKNIPNVTHIFGIAPLFWSLCVPSTCTPQDLQYVLSRINKNMIVNPLLCHTKNSSRPLETIDWIAITVFLLLGILCVLSTTYDLVVTDKEKRNRVLLIFSWYSNGKALFNIRGGQNSLNAIHGIRFLSMCAIVLVHTEALSLAQPSINIIPFLAKVREWPHLYFGNLQFAVDIFFVLSGMLLCYVTMQILDSGRTFNVPIFYLHRFLRITPLWGAVVLVHVSFIDKLGGGPLWDFARIGVDKSVCTEYWWSALLYIQNYVNDSEMCVIPSWFLAVDMQMFWISPIFLITLHKRPKIGVGLTIIASMLGIILSFVESYNHEDHPDFTRTLTTSKVNYTYFHTHTRCVPWFVGLLCGYLVYSTTDWRARVAAGIDSLPKITVTLAWLLAIVLLTGVYVSLHPFQQLDYEYNVVEAALYHALTRPLWAIAITWVIFACVSGYGGLLNTILSWPVWRPLARLTFAIYLIHFDVVLGHIISARVPVYQSVLNKFREFFLNLIVTLILAIVLTLAIESPCVQIEKILFSRGSRNTYREVGNSSEHTTIITMKNK